MRWFIVGAWDDDVFVLGGDSAFAVLGDGHLRVRTDGATVRIAPPVSPSTASVLDALPLELDADQVAGFRAASGLDAALAAHASAGSAEAAYAAMAAGLTRFDHIVAAAGGVAGAPGLPAMIAAWITASETPPAPEPLAQDASLYPAWSQRAPGQGWGPGAIVRHGEGAGLGLWRSDVADNWQAPPGGAGWTDVSPEGLFMPEQDEVPPITRRQLLIGLGPEVDGGMGYITAEEALAAAQTGAVPAAVEAVIQTLPEAQRNPARITWATMTLVEIDHPLVPLLAATQSLSEAQLRAFFAAYSQV
jgi:hypothetical protein